MRLWLPAAILALGGCATYYASLLDQRYGAPDPARHDRAATATDFPQVRSILDNRCAVCHGCNDAPCQLNLASHQGLTRGASAQRVYATRLLSAEPTRLFL